MRLARLTTPTSLAVPHDRHPLDPVTFEQGGDVRHRRIGGCGDDVARHHVADLAAMLLHVFGRKDITTHQQLQPPRPLVPGTRLITPEQIAFAHHADKPADGIHDRDRADVVGKQQLGDILHVAVGS